MYMFAGFEAPMYHAFEARGAKVTAWLQTTPTADAMLRPQGCETHWWMDIRGCAGAPNFSPELDLALAERVRALSYPYFVRMQDRIYEQDGVRRGSWLDTCNKMEMMLHFFHGLLTRNEVSCVISANVPHDGPHIILHYLAQEMGLQNVVATQASAFKNAFWLMEDFTDFGRFEGGVKGDALDFRVNPAPATPFYMNKGVKKNVLRSQMRHKAKMAMGALKIATKAPFAAIGVRPRTFQKSLFKYNELEGLRRLHEEASGSVPETPERYVYAPLHLQPEMTTDALGGAYGDQLLAIEDLARRLPEDVWIYIKENPKQTQRMRDPSFFERLRRIPRTRYLSIENDSFSLIRGAEAVATITGAAGWEALQMGKPAICFGAAWYRNLPGAIQWSPDFDYVQAVEAHRFDPDALQAALTELSRYARPGVVDPLYSQVVEDFDETANAARVATAMLDFAQARSAM